MEIFRSDVKSGIFIVAAVVICLIAIFKVGDLWERFHPATELTLHFTHAQQVSKGTAVYLLGRKVGRVKKIDFSADGSKIHVIASVDNHLPLWAGTRAQIADKSLLGGKMIALIPPKRIEGTQPVALDPSQPIQGLPPTSLLTTIESMSLLLGDFRQQTNEVFDHLNHVLANLDQGIDDTRSRVDSASTIIPKFEDTVDKYSLLADTVKTKLSGLIDQMDAAVDTVVPATTKMEYEIQNLAQQLQRDFTQSRQALEAALDGFKTLTDHTNELVLQNQSELTQAIQRLNDTLAELEDFSQQIAEKPSRLIWGRAKKNKRSEEKTAPQTDTDEPK